jgi:hypothetical protein
MIALILFLLSLLNPTIKLDKTPTFPNFYVANYTNQIVAIDGLIDEPCWQQAEWTNLFIDIEGIEKPRLDTKVKMIYSDSTLYIAALLNEPHLTAFLKEKNKPVFRYDNDFEVFIDPDSDNCNYYELELNAINTIWELSLPFPYRGKGRPIDPDNMPGMKSSIHFNGSINNPIDIDSFWSVEIAFPIRGLRKYGAKKTFDPDDYWRINFSRVQWDYEIIHNQYVRKPNQSESNWVWSPQYEINMHAPEHWGFLFFGPPSNLDVLMNRWKIEQQLLDAFHLWKAGRPLLNENQKGTSKINILKNKPSVELLIEYYDQESSCSYFVDHHSRVWNTCVTKQ